MATKIQLRRDSAVNWAAKNPVLAEGEIGIDLDINRMKVGDGVTPWTTLVFTAGDAPTWSRTGTTVTPKTAGDVLAMSAGTAALPGLTPVGDLNTGLYSAGADQIGIATNGVGRLLADATGGITIPALKSASVANVAVDINGKLIRQALPLPSRRTLNSEQWHQPGPPAPSPRVRWRPTEALCGSAWLQRQRHPQGLGLQQQQRWTARQGR